MWGIKCGCMITMRGISDLGSGDHEPRERRDALRLLLDKLMLGQGRLCDRTEG